MRAIALTLIVLTGCATNDGRPSFEDALPGLATLDVCEAVMLAPPEYADAAQVEAIRRGVRCSDYAEAVVLRRGLDAQRQQAAEAQAREIGRRVLSQPTSRPLGVGCTSYASGAVVSTRCN